MNINDLPLELVVYIFSFIITLEPTSNCIELEHHYMIYTSCDHEIQENYRDLLKLSEVCKYWNKVSKCDYLWVSWNKLFNTNMQVSNLLRTFRTENLQYASQEQHWQFLSDSRENNIQYIIYLEKLNDKNTLINKIENLRKIPYNIYLLSTAYEIEDGDSNFYSRDNFSQDRLVTIDTILKIGPQMCLKFLIRTFGHPENASSTGIRITLNHIITIFN